jgi:hypothetical protein
MTADNEKVIFLAFDNPNMHKANRDVLACRVCRNKTFIARTDIGKWPELYCACCTVSIGAFGWAKQDGDDK